MSDRRLRHSITSALRPLLPLLVTWGVACCFLALLSRYVPVSHEQLMLDPASYSRFPWYTGLVSNLGILGWTCGASLAAGGAWLCHLSGRRGAALMLRGGAELTALLLLDDLFQLHIVVAKELQISKVAFYLVYTLLGTAWLVANSREIVRTRWPLLAAAGLALAVSIAIDQLAPGGSAATGYLVAEDAAKFLGILAWALYFSVTSVDIARSLVRMGRPALAATDSDSYARAEPRRTTPR